VLLTLLPFRPYTEERPPMLELSGRHCQNRANCLTKMFR
jgi:hypothetical protein